MGRRAYFNVIPCDSLEKLRISKYPAYLIVNNKPAGDPGEHWIAIHIQRKNGPISFFCSYGLGIDFYSDDFKNFVEKYRCPIIENIKPLQSVGSNVCGQYALYFLYNKMKGCCIMSTYCHFSPNTKLNDKKVRKFVSFKNHLLHGNCKYKMPIINQCCTNF